MEWIALLLSLLGIFLNAHRYIICWPVWITSNICWLYYNAYKQFDPASIILWSVFLISNIYSWIEWYRENNYKLIWRKI